jgi:hypothetical protein
MTHKTFADGDPEPEVRSGALAVVNYGDYRIQEVWVRCGSNIGNWYPLGNQYGNPALRECPQHPHWEEIVVRGPVTIVTALPQDAYEQGWKDGRQRLYEQVEEMKDDEWAPERETP